MRKRRRLRRRRVAVGMWVVAGWAKNGGDVWIWGVKRKSEVEILVVKWKMGK